MLLNQAVRRYAVQLQADGRSPHTIDQAKRNLALLDTWLVENGHSRDLRRITHETVAQFLASPAARLRRDGQPKRATSVNCTRSVMRTFFAYVHAAGFAPRNAGQLVRRARCASAPPRALSRSDQKRLLDTLAEAEGPVEERDAMLFRLMLETGIRLGSAVALTLDDIDLNHREIRLRVTKNDQPDIAFIPEHLVQPLCRYPCLLEMPGLNRLAQEYQGNDQVVFLAIARDTVTALEAFLEKRAFAFQQAVGDEELEKTFGISFPRNLIIDRSGHVAFDSIGGGENTSEYIGRALRDLLTQY